jgi:hypothetical protein
MKTFKEFDRYSKLSHDKKLNEKEIQDKLERIKRIINQHKDVFDRLKNK